MRGIIYLSLEEDSDFHCVFSREFGDCDYSFLLSINKDKPFIDFWTKREDALDIVSAIKEGIVDEMEFADDFSLSLKELVLEYSGRELDLFTECERVAFIGDIDIDDLVKYLEENPVLKTKKISIKANLNVTDEYFKKVAKLLNMGYDIYFKVPENKRNISFSDFYRTVQKINGTVERIKSKNFSPLEICMYVFDLVCGKPYNRELDESLDYLSRDLTSVLFGDYIVCEGYAVWMSTLLKKLGIKAQVYKLKSIIRDDIGHAQVIALVKDDKYDVHGIYYFDPTGGALEHLSSYNFFALTKEQNEKNLVHINDGEFEDDTFGNFGYELVEGILDNGNIDFAQLDSLTRRRINDVAHFVYGHSLIALPMNFYGLDLSFEGDVLSSEEIQNKLEELVDLIDSPIDASVKVQALINVRKREYYDEPDKFAFSEEEICAVFAKSHWKFPRGSDKDLVEAVLGIKKLPEYRMSCEEFLKNENLDRDIAGVRATRVLNNVLEKRLKLEKRL